MQMNARVKVLGIQGNSGDMEGVVFDFTKIFVETKLDESRGTAKGYGVAIYQYGKSDHFKELQALPYPHEADVTIEMVTTGKVQKAIITSYAPVRAAAPKAS